MEVKITKYFKGHLVRVYGKVSGVRTVKYSQYFSKKKDADAMKKKFEKRLK